MNLNKTVKEDIVQQQILQAAKKLFQTYGLHKVTMDDVAKAIGKGRSSLYYYYKSKDEIFDAVVGIEIGEMLQAMDEAVEKADSVVQKLQAFFVTKLKVLSKKKSFFSAVNIGMDAEALTDFNKTKTIHHNYIMAQESVLLGRILTRGAEQSVLRKMDEKEQHQLILVLLSSLRGIKREMELNNSIKDLDGLIQVWCNMIMQGIRK